jgi:hypothetical protein
VAPSGKACPHIIAVGEPMLVIEIAGLPKRKYRCASCAGEAPPELPPHVEQRIAPRGQPMLPIRAAIPAGVHAADWKSRQAGDREPVEEG